jgi:hypothetical protein
MARGTSGRIVLEIDPELKHHLHALLAAEGRTMKDWFVEAAQTYLRGPAQVQLSLPIAPLGDRRSQSHS